VAGGWMTSGSEYEGVAANAEIVRGIKHLL